MISLQILPVLTYKLFIECDLVFDEINEGYIITEIIKSRNFTVQSYNISNAESVIEVSVIKKIIEINTNVTVNIENNSKITFNGDKCLTIGLKVHPFYYDKESKRVSLDDSVKYDWEPMTILKSNRNKIVKQVFFNEIIDLEL